MTEKPIERLIDIAEVCRQTGVGKSRWYELERKGEAPRHIKEGASSLWVESEIQAWIAERIRRAREQSRNAA